MFIFLVFRQSGGGKPSPRSNTTHYAEMPKQAWSLPLRSGISATPSPKGLAP